MKNILVIYMGNIYVVSKYFMGLCEYFYEWANKLMLENLYLNNS